MEQSGGKGTSPAHFVEPNPLADSVEVVRILSRSSSRPVLDLLRFHLLALPLRTRLAVGLSCSDNLTSNVAFRPSLGGTRMESICAEKDGISLYAFRICAIPRTLLGRLAHSSVAHNNDDGSRHEDTCAHAGLYQFDRVVCDL